MAAHLTAEQRQPSAKAFEHGLRALIDGTAAAPARQHPSGQAR